MIRPPLPLALLAGLLLLLLLPASGRSAKRSAVEFTGVQLRDQDAATMEKGLSRLDLAAMRGFRSRDAVWVVVAPSMAAWERDVMPKLLEGLDAPGAAFKDQVVFLPGSVGRAGPDVSGAVVHVTLPDGRGQGIVSVHLPSLLNSGRAGTGLLNSPAPNRGHFVSGADVSKASDGADRLMRGLYMPSWPRAIGRSGLPRVPLRPIPDDGRGGLVVFGGDVGEEQGEALWDLAGGRTVRLETMETFPRRLTSMTEMLRSVRLPHRALAGGEGFGSAVTLQPGAWEFEERPVRHPTRYLALAAPIAVDLDGEEHTVVLGVVGFYSPLVMTAEEAGAWLGDDEKLLRAVHGGELPFFRDGSEILFLRGWLERFGEGEATGRDKKLLSLDDAREQARSWAGKGKLRGLERASQGPLPMRLVPIPDKERADLVDERVAARAMVDREDLVGWLRRFEPGLKVGDRQPAWSLVLGSEAAEIPIEFSLEEPWEPEIPAPVAKSADQWGSRGGSGDGGGAATASLDGDASTKSRTAFAGEVSLEILDLYASDGVCRIGMEADAALAFDVAGVPDGSVAKLRVEWDLLLEGRSVSRDAWTLERESGGHEVEFAVPCPKEEGSAELYLALLVPGQDELLTEAELPLEVRPPGGRSWPALRMPDAKSCLGGASEGTADEDGFSMGGSVGLSADQISSSVRSFQRQTLRCREGRVVSGTVQVEILVGCDGRVSSAEVTRDTTDDSNFADCVARTMSYAPFPAHDMPDGASFELPLRFE